MNERRYDLVDQKWAHGQAVQDREAQHKAVEANLGDAALTNTQLAVAKAVMQAEFRRKGATVEEATAGAEEAVEKMSSQLVFGRVLAGAKARQRRERLEVKVVYFHSPSHFQEGDGQVSLPSTKQPVRLAMFTL